MIVGGGVLLGVLAYLVRGDSGLVRWDNSVAEWGQRHASDFSTDALELVTHLGEPTVVVVLAVVLAAIGDGADAQSLGRAVRAARGGRETAS